MSLGGLKREFSVRICLHSKPKNKQTYYWFYSIFLANVFTEQIPAIVVDLHKCNHNHQNSHCPGISVSGLWVHLCSLSFQDCVLQMCSEFSVNDILPPQEQKLGIFSGTYKISVKLWWINFNNLVCVFRDVLMFLVVFHSYLGGL